MGLSPHPPPTPRGRGRPRHRVRASGATPGGGGSVRESQSQSLPISTIRSLTLIVRSTVHYPEQYLTLFYLTHDLLTLLSPRTPPAILQCVSYFPVLPSSTIPEKEILISSLPCHIGLDHHTSHAPAPLTSRNSICQ